jgi:hypothetical protein
MRSLKAGRRWWWITGGMFAVAGLVVALALPGLRAGTAAADTGGVGFQDSATGLCLTGVSDGYVLTSTCYLNSGELNDDQLWVGTPAPDGITITNQSDGQCLENDSPGYVYTESCTGGAAQEWVVDSSRANGDSGFCNVYTGMCLDSNSSGNAYTDQGNGDSNQGWDQGTPP